MTEGASSYETLRAWAERYCDGSLSAQETADLERRLRDDPKALEYFVLYMEVHAQVVWDARASAEHRKAENDSLMTDIGVEQGMAPDSELSLPHPIQIIPVGTGFSPTSLMVPLLSYALAAVIVSVGLAIAAFTYVSQPVQLADQQHAPHPQSTTLTPSSVVARITGTADCRWERKGGVVSGEWLAASKSKNTNHKPLTTNHLVALGDQFILSAGLMEITYHTGAKVILQGPCTYQVDSPDGGYLSIGKLTARVEQSTKYGVRSTEQVASGQWPVASDGMQNEKCKLQNAKLTSSKSPNPQIPKSLNPLFAVRTPTATITDLGTEFGIDVDARGVTAVRVFIGKVKASVVSGQTRSETGSQLLGANQSARIEDGHVVLEADDSQPQANHKQFVRSLPITKPHRSDDYAKIVLSMQPSAYYRMEKPQPEEGHSIIDAVQGGRVGEVHLGAATGLLWLDGRFGDALHLRGPMVGDYATVSECPQSHTNQLTVMAWVLADSCSPWATIAKNWGNAHLGQFHLGLAGDAEDLHAFICQSNGIPVELREGKTHSFPIHVWQHVALVVDGATARLYRNGKEVGAIPCSGLLHPSPSVNLAIGCKLGDDGIHPDAQNPGFWRGLIDELAIFHRALPPDAIRQLYAITPVDANTNLTNPRTE